MCGLVCTVHDSLKVYRLLHLCYLLYLYTPHSEHLYQWAINNVWRKYEKNIEEHCEKWKEQVSDIHSQPLKLLTSIVPISHSLIFSLHIQFRAKAIRVLFFLYQQSKTVGLQFVQWLLKQANAQALPALSSTSEPTASSTAISASAPAPSSMPASASTISASTAHTDAVPAQSNGVTERVQAMLQVLHDWTHAEVQAQLRRSSFGQRAAAQQQQQQQQGQAQVQVQQQMMVQEQVSQMDDDHEKENDPSHLHHSTELTLSLTNTPAAVHAFLPIPISPSPPQQLQLGPSLPNTPAGVQGSKGRGMLSPRTGNAQLPTTTLPSKIPILSTNSTTNITNAKIQQLSELMQKLPTMIRS